MGCAKSRDAKFNLNESNITQQEMILGIYKKEVIRLDFALKKFGISERINEKQLLMSLQYANLPTWISEENQTNNIKFFYQHFLEKDLYKRDELILALIFLSGSSSERKAQFVFENLDWKTQGYIDKSKVQKYADIICQVTDQILPQMAILNLKGIQAEANYGQNQTKNYIQERKQEEITKEIKKMESLVHQ